MNQTTKYRYEKRIKYLEDALAKKENALFEYKQLTLDIFSTVTTMIQDGKQINQGWLISKFKRLFL